MANEVEIYLGRAKANVSRSKKAIIKRKDIPDQENYIWVFKTTREQLLKITRFSAETIQA